MWFKPKTVLAAGLAACLVFQGTGVTVRADGTVDASTVGIISKVDEYIEGYMGVKDYILLYIILLFMSYLISTKFAKKIFKDSAMKTLKEEV